MSTTLERPPVTEAFDALTGGLSASVVAAPTAIAAPTLGSLPVGARLVVRCRKDWRAATVAAFEREAARVVLNVASPSGHTYSLRRPPDALLSFDGAIPLLGEGAWRVQLARYDVRW